MSLSFRRFASSVCLSLLVVSPAGAAVEVHPSIQRALDRLYNFDFDGAHSILDGYSAAEPEDPLGFTIRGAIYLFYELDRLHILEAEFFKDDSRILDRKKLKPDPQIRDRFLATLERAEALAAARLEEDPGDINALFALCMRAGLVTDYVGLIEKKGLRSLKHSRVATAHAVQLLELQPDFYDAYLGSGSSTSVSELP